MAITLDADSEGTTNTPPLTISHTTATNASALVISVGVRTQGAGSIDSVTYGGITCTLVVVRQVIININNRVGSAMYVLFKPDLPSGTNDLVIVTSGGGPRIAANVSTWIGDISLGDDSEADGLASSDISVDVDTAPGDVAIDSAAVYRDPTVATSITVDGDQTQLSNQTIGVAGAGVVHGASFETATGASTNMGWTISAALIWVSTALVLKDSGARLLGQLGCGQ